MLYAACGLLFLTALLVYTDTIWSDFAQRVYVAVLGSSGSAAVVISLYFLKRWHDRRDEAYKTKAAEQVRYKSELLEYVRGLREDILTSPNSYLEGDLTARTLIIGARFNEYGTFIEDDGVREFCVRSAMFVQHIGQPGNEESYNLEHRRRLMAYIGIAGVRLHDYMTVGVPIDYGYIFEMVTPNMDDDSEKPISSEEEPG
ncbi:hypothetical protein [Modestobacter lacusdianchii]